MEQIATASGDSFAGGFIMGICVSGAVWSIVMAVAYAI